MTRHSNQDNAEGPAVLENEDYQPEQSQPKDELRVAYVVGVKKDGSFVFDIHGEKESAGLIELLGLHQYAEHRIKNAVDTNQGTGDAVTVHIARKLGELEQTLNKVLEQLGEEDTPSDDSE